ncbi:Cyclic-AMP response element binding protein A [Carabus blaptoides fortunei]
METFAVDKCFYDIGASDLKELWDSELDPDVLRVAGAVDANDMAVEWSFLDRDPMLPGVILHDRLMTDAALGTLPIKTEHSYSLASDGDSLPESPISHNKIEMEDDFPTICVNPSAVRLSSPVTITIKDEPLSEPDSPTSSCPGSPLPNFSHTHHDFDMDTDTMIENMQQSVLKQSHLSHSTRSTIYGNSQRITVPKLNIKIEPTTSGFTLPPTPPSCSSSEESEDNASCSQPSSPGRPSRPSARVLLTTQTSTRQPIHTPLISSQPKGSTGTLVLTDEEKRTLLAEGYPVPTRLPLTKAEEKSLKKIRRKIKNKISAQESRRKKKEYMDQLERKVEILVSENNDYRKKIENLEDSNNNLLNQLAKLQAIVARTHPHVMSRHGKFQTSV